MLYLLIHYKGYNFRTSSLSNVYNQLACRISVWWMSLSCFMKNAVRIQLHRTRDGRSFQELLFTLKQCSFWLLYLNSHSDSENVYKFSDQHHTQKVLLVSFYQQRVNMYLLQAPEIVRSGVNAISCVNQFMIMSDIKIKTKKKPKEFTIGPFLLPLKQFKHGLSNLCNTSHNKGTDFTILCPCLLLLRECAYQPRSQSPVLPVPAEFSLALQERVGEDTENEVACILGYQLGLYFVQGQLAVYQCDDLLTSYR